MDPLRIILSNCIAVGTCDNDFPQSLDIEAAAPRVEADLQRL